MNSTRLNLFFGVLVFAYGINSNADALDLPNLGRLNLKKAEVDRAFKENWARYPAPLAILKKLSDKFPAGTGTQICLQIAEQTKNALGVNDPASGSPAFDEPTSAFVEFWSDCVWSMAERELYNGGSPLLAILNEVEASEPGPGPYGAFKAADLDSKWFENKVLKFIDYFYGPGVIQNPTPFSDAVRNRVRAELEAAPNTSGGLGLKQVAQIIAHELCMKDAFIMIGWTEETP